MQYGTALPITAFSDPAQTRDYAQALEEAGFDFTSTSAPARTRHGRSGNMLGRSTIRS